MYKLKKQLFPIILIIFILSASSVSAVPRYFDEQFAEPDTGYISNVVIDILVHNFGGTNSIWFATDEGLNYSYDGGVTWLYYNSETGLISSSVSAFQSVPSAMGQRIWVATNHNESIDGNIFGFSDGVSYSDDNGLNWTQIQFDTPPNDIDYVWGGDRTIFDIDGHYDPLNEDFDDWMFFSAFAGGFLASRDGGDSWRRIFPSQVDSIQFYNTGTQPSLNNRYFSCAVDTSHGDTLFVWAGTAGGFYQYTFIEPGFKSFVRNTKALEFCQNCPADDSSFLYIGGKTGFTRSDKDSKNNISRFEDDGLPGNNITAMLDFGDKLFVGTADKDIDSLSNGLAYSTDHGNSFTPVILTEVEGNNNIIKEFEVLNDRIYIAAQNAGLFVSADTGNTWEHIFVDSLGDTVNGRTNVVLSLDAWGDTLRVGTDSGLVQLRMDPNGVFNPALSDFYFFDNSDTSGAAVIKVRTQNYQGTDILWTLNNPLDGDLLNGSPIVGRSDDGGATFSIFNMNAANRDIDFIGDTTLLAGEYGLLYTDNGTFPVPQRPDTFYVNEYFISGTDTTVIDIFNMDTINVIETKGDTILLGSSNGYAVSTDGGLSFNITRAKIDSLSADFVIHYSTAITGIEGDWVPALEVQYGTSDSVGRVWISTRPTFGGVTAISASIITDIVIVDSLNNPIDTLFNQRIWRPVHDNFAWNFAFAGDTVFAATNDGLIYGIGDSLIFNPTYQWKTLELRDSLGYSLLLEGTPIYGVAVDSNYVWVGSDDRTVRLNRGDLTIATPFYVVDDKTPADEVYSFPAPYSHTRDNQLEFHFVVDKPADITLEIYDFAMNLVYRVIDSEPFTPDIYPTAGYGRRTWDGMNGKGDPVAVGVYYFKVEYSTGEIRWGKLAVIP